MAWVLASALATGITGDIRIAVVALVFFVRLVCRGEVSRKESVIVAFAAIVFFSYGYVSTAGIRKDIGRVCAESRVSAEAVTLEGWVCRFPYYRYGGVAFEFRTRIAGLEHTVLVQTREFWISYGDSLRVRGTWKTPGGARPEPWRARLLSMGVQGHFRALPAGVERLGGSGGTWVARRVFFRCHDRIRQELCRGLGSRSGIPVALLIGERGYLDRRANEAFRELGLSHLLALSGLHLGFVAAALVLLLRALGRRGEMALLAALALYVGIVGPIISLYRAFVMAAVVIVASLVKRPLAPLGALVRAFILILLVYPHAFFSVGFQLSFTATFAVLVCVRSLRPPGKKTVAGRVGFWVRSSLQVSLAAQLVVAPLILHYFERVSLLSPLATLLFVLPTAFVLFASAFAALVAVSAPVAGPFVFAGLDRVSTLFQSALVFSADRLPGAVSPPAPDTGLYYGGLLLFWVGRRRWWAWLAGIAVVASSFCVGPLGR